MEILYVVACVANPLRWRSRIALARAALNDWLKEPNVHITLAECAYGSRSWDLADLASARLNHIPLRATTMAWSKECLLNIAIAHLPHAADKIAVLDADITFRRSGWATETLAALDLYPVVQPWVTAYDLGPHDEHVQTHKSFASVWHADKPVVATVAGFWSFNGGYNTYLHPGYAWGWQRHVLDRIGGLLEIGAMGSGDHHMALGMLGNYKASVPSGASDGYKNSSPRGLDAQQLRSTTSSDSPTARLSIHFTAQERARLSNSLVNVPRLWLRPCDRPQAQHVWRPRILGHQA
jgi:hypothetical protein